MQEAGTRNPDWSCPPPPPLFRRLKDSVSVSYPSPQSSALAQLCRTQTDSRLSGVQFALKQHKLLHVGCLTPPHLVTPPLSLSRNGALMILKQNLTELFPRRKRNKNRQTSWHITRNATSNHTNSARRLCLLFSFITDRQQWAVRNKVTVGVFLFSFSTLGL